MNASAKGKVLVVDGDRFLLDVFCAKLSEAGFDVHACLSVEEGLEALRGDLRPDAVLFGLSLAGKDGYSLLQYAKDEGLAKGAAKIALTDHDDDEGRKKALELGADRCLIKGSAVPAEVVNTVEEEISRHRGA